MIIILIIFNIELLFNNNIIIMTKTTDNGKLSKLHVFFY